MTIKIDGNNSNSYPGVSGATAAYLGKSGSPATAKVTDSEIVLSGPTEAPGITFLGEGNDVDRAYGSTTETGTPLKRDYQIKLANSFSDPAAGLQTDFAHKRLAIYGYSSDSTSANDNCEIVSFDVSNGFPRTFVTQDLFAGRRLNAGVEASNLTHESASNGFVAVGRSSNGNATHYQGRVQLLADYRGPGSGETDTDYAPMLYCDQKTTAGVTTGIHMLDTKGRSWHYSALYTGRCRKQGSGDDYRSGEHSVYAYAGSGGSFTYICGRNVADSSFVYQADVNTPRIEFRANGNGYFDGGADLGNADYAEMFEWSDGNPNNEDRRGYSVVLEGEKIRIATSEDPVESVIGIVSVEPGVLGDSAALNWHGEWLRDEFGTKLTTPVEYLVWNTDPEAPKPTTQTQCGFEERMLASKIGSGDEEDKNVPDHARADNVRRIFHQLVPNPDYDPSMTYTARRERKEWEAVGLMGKLPLRKGEPVGSRWLMLKSINDQLNLWLVR